MSSAIRIPALALRLPACLLLLLLLVAGCSLFGGDDEQAYPFDPDIPAAEAFDAFDGAWNADGTRIAFSHLPEPGEPKYLWIADLTTGRRWAVLPRHATDTDWSPDDARLLFSSVFGLFAADTSGRRVVPLTGEGSPNPALDASYGRWSPDGTRVLFTVFGGEPRGIGIMNADGSGARLLVPYGQEGAWFPDGRRFVFRNWDMRFSEDSHRGLQLYTAGADGSDVRKLTDLPGSDQISAPAVSPDGTKIAFIHRAPDFSGEVFVMNADGTDIRQMTDGRGEAHAPAWRPDGRVLLFHRVVYTDDYLPGSGFPPIQTIRQLFLLDTGTLEVEPVFPAN